MPPEFAFLASRLGVVSILVAAALALLLTVFWAYRPGHTERLFVLTAAAASLILLTAITVLAVYLGWWQGAFASLPILSLIGLYVFLSFPGFSLWIGIYRWLEKRTRLAIWFFAAICLAFIPVVFIVDPWQMQRGQFFMGSGYTVLADAIVGQVVLWAPILFFKLFRRARRSNHGAA